MNRAENNQKNKGDNHWRLKLYKIIFEAETRGGKAFDVALLWAILISVIVVMLESVKSIDIKYGFYLRKIEWTFTLIFTIEYILRIFSARKSIKYIFSFLGIVDFLAIIPSYLSLLVSGTQFLLVIRTIRLLRVFRIFKLTPFLGSADKIVSALRASRPKITVFLMGVLSLVSIMGTLMYLIEGEQNGFTSIPRSIYWAIVTLTTVGYGDIAPVTVLGQTLASCIMILGYSIIAVPTGIVSVELSKSSDKKTTLSCKNCHASKHEEDARYCHHCGYKL